MQQNHAKIQAEGAELIVISSDNQNATRTTVQNNGLKFPVLSDSDLDTIAEYNVVDPGNKRLSRPASFVINFDGIVTWKALGTTNHRVPTQQILTELGKID